MKKTSFLFLIFFLAGCQAGLVNVNVDPLVNEPVDPEQDSGQTAEPEKPVAPGVPATVQVPAELELKVLFASQAPLLVWDALHKEACEEASMIMAARYFKGKSLDNQIMETEIQKLVKWENENGYKADLTAAEVVEIFKDYFNQKAKVVSEVTADRIKYELSRGNLVIAPAAGQELGNPNFQTPGPIYHMLLIKGYDSNEFITNDPGTRKGDGFRYGYSRLLDAVHDWDHAQDESGMTAEEMVQGKKVMVVVEKSLDSRF